MRLHELLPKLTAEQRNVLAEKCGTSVNYLYQLAGGHRRPSMAMAANIAQATGGKVPISSWLSQHATAKSKTTPKAA